jgi:oxepin-CoA hydrolase/3-oxo-5,6-dehydrosuberyl-CoA semialdehyde dehydrogenase
MSTYSKRDFLNHKFPELLKTLRSDTKANFGLMTPQHMVEHLIGALGSATTKFEGERILPATEQQLGMQKFIQSGSVLVHRPSAKTNADLPPLTYASLEEAVSNIPEAVQKYYAFQDNNPEYKPYAPFMGEVSYEDVELFHYMHIKYHLWQFGLLAQYP